MDARKRAAGPGRCGRLRVAGAPGGGHERAVKGNASVSGIAGVADQVRAAVLRRWSRSTTRAASRPTPRIVAEEMLR